MLSKSFERAHPLFTCMMGRIPFLHMSPKLTHSPNKSPSGSKPPKTFGALMITILRRKGRRKWQVPAEISCPGCRGDFEHQTPSKTMNIKGGLRTPSEDFCEALSKTTFGSTSEGDSVRHHLDPLLRTRYLPNHVSQLQGYQTSKRNVFSCMSSYSCAFVIYTL